ncbi:MAG TPA: IS110 family transposase [Acidimicrobiales bacterium]|nr:IS110 family transposase [Acidimicrobiales bacterium]
MDQHQQYVGIDLHRRRSVIVRRNDTGETLDATRVDNADTAAFTRAVMAAGEHPVVVLESTYGWYWAADWLAELGCEVHLAHPLGNNWGNRRVKNDVRDAEDLAYLYRLGRLAEAWIAPPAVRELRESVRHRVKLVRLRANLKSQTHAVLAKEGIYVPMTDLFGVAGNELITTCELGPAYRNRVESLRELMDVLEREITQVEDDLYRRLRHDAGYRAIQAISGVGPVLAAVFVAEIGDVTRFSSPNKLASWCGLTPRHRESDTTVHRGSISKQGSRLVRWAAVEAAQKQRRGSRLRDDFARITANHGDTAAARKIARVAVARKIVTLVYYGLRHGVITSLAADEAA